MFRCLFLFVYRILNLGEKKLNTERYILKNVLFKKIMMCTQEEYFFLINYLDVYRKMEEVRQLFDVLECNINLLADKYLLRYDDMIINHETGNVISFIEINTHTINILSAGKQVVEHIENFIKKHNDKAYKKMKKEVINKIYDNHFTYRFLMLLRNYTQHGHLPVSVYGEGRCCFDLLQIINTPSFNFGNREEEIRNIINEIREKYKDQPRITYVKFIDEFLVHISNIYRSYFDYIEEYVKQLKNQYELMNKKIKKYVNKRGKLKGLVIISKEDDKDSEEIHAFEFDNNLLKAFYEFKNRAQETLDYYKSINNGGNDYADLNMK